MQTINYIIFLLCNNKNVFKKNHLIDIDVFQKFVKKYNCTFKKINIDKDKHDINL